MQCRFIALFVLALFVLSCDQDKPTAQVESAPADLDESLTTIEVNGAVFRRVAAKAVSTAQGGDMSIVLNYSTAGSKASIASVTIDGVTFLSSGCDPSTQRGIVELVTDNAITPSTDFESRTQLELPEIEEYGDAIWKHFGPYKLEAGATHYFEFPLGAKMASRTIALSDIGLRGRAINWDGRELNDGGEDTYSFDGPGPEENFLIGVENPGDVSTTEYFKVRGASPTTEGIYTILVQASRGVDERPPRDVGDTRSSAFELPFPTVFFDDYSLSHFSPSFYITEGDVDYFIIDVPQRVDLRVGLTNSGDLIVNPSIKLVRSNRRIAAASSNYDEISKTIDAGKYWIKIEGEPSAGQEETIYRIYYSALPASE